ncbi:MAG: alkaline phosphatase [Aliidiomarina sp.]|uniref:alkaline phosphatase n=1 Tax=Aliidiomarina sp. TaxID=1872439 RepID=UPI0025C4CF83|nr:alkaline phosphatase [Aliidiomarina sp.]MCH8502261.1 alkaline phosphatase [Aliidiomarina sp.]
MRIWQKITHLSLVAVVATSLFAWAPNAHADDSTSVQPQRIILVIADGMGFPYLTAYRYFKDGRNFTHASDISPTIFDNYLVGAASTYPADDTLVTDSAASATALATGIKTYNGAISVDADGNPLKTMMQIGRENGWLTGAIATTRVTHATPAAFYTHVPSRRMEDEIADQYATLDENGQPIFDLLLGSGRKHFVRTDEDGTEINHLTTLTDAGVRIVETYEELHAQQRLPVLGLFFDDAFPYVIDDEMRLEQLSRHGLRLFDNTDQPYVVMIEASMVDWCGHANDIACAMREMEELDHLMQFLEAYANENPGTQVLLTADHSTGGLTLGADGNYQWRAADVARIGRGLRTMAEDLTSMPFIDWEAYVEQYLPFPLTVDQQNALQTVAQDSGSRHRQRIQDVLIDIVRYHTSTGWTTGGHTGEDVPVIAIGPWSDRFRGFQDQTDIADIIINWLQ